MFNPAHDRSSSSSSSSRRHRQKNKLYSTLIPAVAAKHFSKLWSHCCTSTVVHRSRTCTISLGQEDSIAEQNQGPEWVKKMMASTTQGWTVFHGLAMVSPPWFLSESKVRDWTLVRGKWSHHCVITALNHPSFPQQNSSGDNNLTVLFTDSSSKSTALFSHRFHWLSFLLGLAGECAEAKERG